MHGALCSIPFFLIIRGSPLFNYNVSFFPKNHLVNIIVDVEISGCYLVLNIFKCHFFSDVLSHFIMFF